MAIREIEHPMDVAYFRELDRQAAHDEAVEQETESLLQQCLGSSSEANEARETVFSCYLQDVCGTKTDLEKIMLLLVYGKHDEAKSLAQAVYDSKEFEDSIRWAAETAVFDKTQQSEWD